jgi:hypothetical protein
VRAVKHFQQGAKLPKWSDQSRANAVPGFSRRDAGLSAHTSPLTLIRHCANNNARQHYGVKGWNSYFLSGACVNVLEMERG